MSKEQWNQFIIKNGGSFLQSWQWGEFQESLGRKIWRIESNNSKGLVVRHNLPFKKNYLYCPRGPVGDNDLKYFLEEIHKIAKQEKSIFFKIESERDLNGDSPLWGLSPSSKQIQPNKTIILDLNKSKEGLLDQMHQKTRYNIRLAQKKGLIFEEVDNSELDIFLELLRETAKRDKFSIYPEEYYRKMQEISGRDGMIKMFSIKYDNKIIAANLVCFFGKTAIYLHGASDYNYHNLMAPYLLQWETILKAKDKGFISYDFWGINEKKWPGVTRFKKGFNGQEINYSGAFDLIFNKTWYKMYNLVRKIL